MSKVNIPTDSNYMKRKHNPKKKAEQSILAFKELLKDKTHLTIKQLHLKTMKLKY